ncbi:MAG: hypothetical protein HYY15_03825 [Candidatus Omnitrophica bacterium]|nr:hypothetical protein [Candidatus Omnitrophota bacterium]
MRHMSTLMLAAAAGAAATWLVALPTRVTAASSPAARESKADLAAIDRKLDQIADQQVLILQQLQAMAEELRIIKVRATR